MSVRRVPNILVTGTPGTGKTTLCESLVSRLDGAHHLAVGSLVEEKELYEGRDEDMDAWILDEDRVVDAMEDSMELGGQIVDHHGCDFFPQRWFDLVVVLRANNTILFDRLASRGYNDNKIQENVSAEIFRVILDEALESYEENIVLELQNDDEESLQSNLETIMSWWTSWIQKASSSS